MSADDRLLVIVPALNEEPTVAKVVQALREHGYDVLVIDDGSTDRTAVTAKSAGARVVQLPFNLGVGGALKCGFAWAVAHGYRCVVQCDADGQHRADQIDHLVSAQRQTGADLVIGSRFAHDPDWKVGRMRRMAMRIMARLATRAARNPISDATSGFRLIASPLLDEFAHCYPEQYLGDTFEALIAAGRAGYEVREIPALLDQRRAGRSSATTSAGLRYAARAVLVTTLGLQVRIAPARPRDVSVDRTEVASAR